MSPRFLLPSVVIVLVLLAQVVVTVTGAAVKWKHNTFEDHYWPFLDYPMYSEAYGPPVQTSTVELLATLPDGQTAVVDATYMGLDFFGWRYHIVERLVAPVPTGQYAHFAEAVAEHRAEALRRVVSQVETVAEATPVALTVNRRVYTIEDNELIEHDEVSSIDPQTSEVTTIKPEARESELTASGGDA